MGSRLREDEKNERIIRGLIKQPSNRKCINCNLLGPQYVCTTFSTFVCTTCGGIHREFTHRVKSVSMSKFTPQEIASLQAGGNERAREIFFKEWDPQRHSAPDTSNVDRLRDFIKHVYVDRRYAGERTIDKPPRVKLGDKEEPNESRRSDGYQSGSRSLPYDDMYERRHSERASPGYDVRRSPGYDQDSQRYSDYGRSPGLAGVANDWRREDRFSNGKKSEDRRSLDGESKSEIRSPDHENDNDISSPPVVRPVRDILGDNVAPLRIGEPPKSNSSRVADVPAIAQRTTSSSSLASSSGNPAELKRETSLIDFDAQLEPPVTAGATPAQQSTTSQPVTQSTSVLSDDNWASFDNVPENKVSQAPPDSNSLESVLTQLSVPAPAPVSRAASSNNASTPSNDLFPPSTTGNGNVLFASVGNASTAAPPRIAAAAASPITSLSSFPSGGVAAAAGLSPALPVNGGTGQLSTVQHHQQPFPHGGPSQPAAQQFPSSFPSVSNNQGLTGNPVVQASQPLTNLAAQTVEVKSSWRKELPADLFTTAYQPVYYQAPMWQAGVIPGMGYHMQYNPAMAMPTIPQPTTASNPFNVNTGASPAQVATFPSMLPLHAALPNTAAPRGIAYAPNLGPMPSWMPPQSSSYSSTVPSLAQSFGSAMPGGTYMGQQLATNMAPSRPQGFGSFSGEGAFGSLNPAAATPSPSLSGNPFG